MGYKIKRRGSNSKGQKSILVYVIIGIIALVVLFSSVIYLCVEFLSKKPALQTGFFQLQIIDREGR